MKDDRLSVVIQKIRGVEATLAEVRGDLRDIEGHPEPLPAAHVAGAGDPKPRPAKVAGDPHPYWPEWIFEGDGWWRRRTPRDHAISP